MKTMPHKRGDSFVLVATIPAAFADGHFVGYTPAGQVRAPGGDALVADLVLEWADPATTRHLKITAMDTRAWPLGLCLFDIQFTRDFDGYVTSTSTAGIRVNKDATYG